MQTVVGQANTQIWPQAGKVCKVIKCLISTSQEFAPSMTLWMSRLRGSSGKRVRETLWHKAFVSYKTNWVFLLLAILPWTDLVSLCHPTTKLSTICLVKVSGNDFLPLLPLPDLVCRPGLLLLTAPSCHPVICGSLLPPIGSFASRSRPNPSAMSKRSVICRHSLCRNSRFSVLTVSSSFHTIEAVSPF